MPVTPESLVRHELVGLAARVAAAPNEDLVGIEGTVVTETTRTLGIEQSDDSEGRSPSGSRTQSDDSERPRLSGSRTESGDSGRVAHVPKEGATVTFTLPSGTDVTVEGRRLEARPPRRTENTGDSKWR